MREKSSKNEMDESLFPIVKFSYEGNVIYANAAAGPLLRYWKCNVNEKISSAFVYGNPEVFCNLHELSDVKIVFHDCVFRFTVVPFPEADFIGIYGYQMEMSENAVVKKEFAIK